MSEVIEAVSELLPVEALPHVPTLAQIKRFEKLILSCPSKLDELTLRHTFAPGLYAREMTIPAGIMLTGKIHKTTHINIISAGDITVWTEQGMKRIQAPYTFVSYPGTKRIGLTHAETVWTTLHVTEETDLVRLEADLTEPEGEMLEVDMVELLKEFTS